MGTDCISSCLLLIFLLYKVNCYAYSRAGACCACSRCRTGGLFLFLSRLSYLPFLMPRLLGDG